MAILVALSDINNPGYQKYVIITDSEHSVRLLKKEPQ